MIGLTSCPFTAWGMQSNMCLSGTCECQGTTTCIPCGKSNYDCQVCTCVDCKCPSKVVDFVGSTLFTYTFSKGFYFACLSPQDVPQQKTSNRYSCSSGNQSLPEGEQLLEKSITVNTSDIYMFESEITFKCSEPPLPITASVPVEGLPSKYYLCPGGAGGD